MKKRLLKKVVAVALTMVLAIGHNTGLWADEVNDSETNELPLEVTTEPVKINKGESFLLTSKNINPLLPKEIVSEDDTIDHSYWAGSESNGVVFDESYLVSVYAYDYVTVDEYKSVYNGYGTEEEMNAIYAQFDENWEMEYNGVTVTLVESPVPYCVRAQKTGNVVLTIPNYVIGSGVNAKTVTVNIPFEIDEEFSYGDATGDDKINVMDAVIIKKHIAGFEGLDIIIDACDVNSDNRVNVMDAVMILKYIAGYDVVLGK